MKMQALFSSKDKSKSIRMSSAAIFGRFKDSVPCGGRKLSPRT